MGWLKRGLGFVVVLGLAVATLLFVLENQSVAALQFMGWIAPNWPVSVWVVAAFILGGLLGLSLGWLVCCQLKVKLRRANAALKKTAEDSAKMRAQLLEREVAVAQVVPAADA